VLVLEPRASRAASTLALLERLGARSVAARDLSGALALVGAPGACFATALVDAELDGASAAAGALAQAGLQVVLLVQLGAAPLVPGARVLARPLSALETRAALEAIDQAPASSRATPAPRRQLCVLVAEDNPINSTVARRLIERAGHLVTHVWNGHEAVEEVARTRFDLVLMDIQMPVLDGLEATRRIRAAEGRRRPQRIYAMTANAMRADELECLDAGMDGFLTKPVDSKRLMYLLDAISLAEVD
jgi:CheY-like chemotaxis protein